jgi:hypothetical protein
MAKNRLGCFFPINSSEQFDLFVTWMVQIFQADPFLDPLSFDQLTQDIHNRLFFFVSNSNLGPCPSGREAIMLQGRPISGRPISQKNSGFRLKEI